MVDWQLAGRYCIQKGGGNSRRKWLPGRTRMRCSLVDRVVCTWSAPTRTLPRALTAYRAVFRTDCCRSFSTTPNHLNTYQGRVNPLQFRCNYSATPNNMKLVHWQLMGGLLYLVQRGGDWAGP